MKRIAWLVAIGVWAVAACAPQSAATPAPTVTNPPAPTATNSPAPTALPQSPAASAPAPTSAPQQITPEMVFQPQPGDWVRGPEDALVTIIEWGDFQ